MSLFTPTADAVTGGPWLRSLILREIVLVILICAATSLTILRAWMIGMSLVATILQALMLYWLTKPSRDANKQAN